MRRFEAAIAVMAVLSTAFAGWAQDGADRMAWWREARFGLFIHWGPVSLKGTEIGWSRDGERPGLKSGRGSVPVEVYDNLYKEFNPTGFNADEWVAIAQRAGMKYLVFTTKHHDGFCMFDSALTDYKITNSPFKRDVVAELAEACHKAGLGLGFYYSPPDWHHPDYRRENSARYIDYMHGQLRELCTNYGKVDILWFDGLNSTADELRSRELVAMIRELQPGIIINNRSGLPEDHDTPEQRVGKFQTDRPWESCITIANQWAWKPGDPMKSLKACLDTLVSCAGGDGNLLFNVGPRPDGLIDPPQAQRLAEMGAWLQQYGETIYGTRGGPFKPGPWGASTNKGNTVYLHVRNWDAAGPVLRLPALEAGIVSHRLLSDGSAKVTTSSDGLEITFSDDARARDFAVLAIELDKPAMEVPPVGMPSASLVAGGKATASNVYQSMDTYAAAKALDDDEGTRWATDGGTHEAWLQVEVAKPVTVGQVLLMEYETRVEDFSILYRDGSEWKSCYDGKRIGERRVERFTPVTSNAFRLEIRRASEGPTLFEFQLLPPLK